MLLLAHDNLTQIESKAQEIGLCINNAKLTTTIPSKIYTCGTTANPRGANGRYLVKYDPITEKATVLFWNFETSSEKAPLAKVVISLRDPNTKPLTSAERQQQRAHMAANLKRQREQADRENAEKAINCRDMFKVSEHCAEHEYFEHKGIVNLSKYGFKKCDGAVRIPFTNGIEMQGFQTIRRDGVKRFTGSIGGCWWQYPNNQAITGNHFYIIGEGVATVLSAYKAIVNAQSDMLPIALVGFNAGNLSKVISNTKDNNLPYLLLVDNDSTKSKNAGVEAMLQILTEHSGIEIYPLVITDGVSNDANDFILKNGAMAFIKLVTDIAPKFIGDEL